MHQLLYDINYAFDIIGSTETWLRSKCTDNIIVNIDLPGYTFLSQPSQQRVGGVGVYIKNSLKFHSRDELNLCTIECETLWIEIKNQLYKNIICCIIYRHPNSNLECFLNQLFTLIEKANTENKYCFLLGDFNINLLNYDTHTQTEDFINTLNSYFFEPRIVSYLDKLLIITDNQFGFRSKHSTSHALILLTEKIRKSIDQGLFTCGIFLDLCKAFDTVHHSILLDKLSNYGIRGKAHDWFSSYLSNRRQFVSIGSSNSDPLPVRCGVPQGLVLGPLLFLIYVNDFQKCSDLLEFHLFADDTNLFSNNANIHDLESNIKSELEKVNTWLCANELSLNLEKTSFVIFHPPQKHIHYKVRLQISNKLLKQDSHIKYLGIIFDSRLNWKKHIHELGKKISKSIGILSKIRHFVSIDILIQLYYCFVYSLITYGILVWVNTYETSLKSLTTLQNKAIRIITFSK